MASKRVNELRSLARKRRAAATSKIGRIRRNIGVDLTGSSLDPRRDPKIIARYTEPQLVKYINEINHFVDRSNQVVAGAQGTVIPKTAWDEYKRLETQYNKIGSLHFNAVADIFIPHAGMTIKEYNATIRPDSVSAQGDIVNTPFQNINRKPANVTNAKALKKLIDDLKKKVKTNYMSVTTKQARETLNKMLTSIGQHGMMGEFAELTDHQFNTAWAYGLARATSTSYHIHKQSAAKMSEWEGKVTGEQHDDIRDILDWAKTLQDPKQGTQRPKTRKTRGRAKKR